MGASGEREVPRLYELGEEVTRGLRVGRIRGRIAGPSFCARPGQLAIFKKAELDRYVASGEADEVSKAELELLGKQRNNK